MIKNSVHDFPAAVNWDIINELNMKAQAIEHPVWPIDFMTSLGGST